MQMEVALRIDADPNADGGHHGEDDDLGDGSPDTWTPSPHPIDIFAALHFLFDYLMWHFGFGHLYLFIIYALLVLISLI